MAQHEFRIVIESTGIGTGSCYRGYVALSGSYRDSLNGAFGTGNYPDGADDNPNNSKFYLVDTDHQLNYSASMMYDMISVRKAISNITFRTFWP